ncbi:MAG: carbonic anhydrase [Isosphaeraceae bacterium]
MDLRTWTRRRWLGLLGSSPLVAGTSRAADPPASDSRPGGAAEALDALKAGNRRFAGQKPRHAHQAADWRAHLVGGQQPFATILACSDSRVPPELVFDQGFGDLFVIRVAGNVVADDVVGSIGYALRHLKTRLVVVMGHEGCGAVTAALEAIDGKGAEPRFIAKLLSLITPGLRNLDPKLTGTTRVNAGVEANVRSSMEHLAGLPGARDFIENQQCRLVGAVYELGTGRVRFLD